MIPIRNFPVKLTKRHYIYLLTLIGLLLFVGINKYYSQKQVRARIVEFNTEIGSNEVTVTNLTSSPPAELFKIERVPSNGEVAFDPESPRQKCNCSKRQGLLPNLDPRLLVEKGITRISTCSNEATDQGPGQKVISYSLYLLKPEDIKFFKIEPLLDEVRLLFPGWMVRIYTNVSTSTSTYPYACRLICKYDFLFWCNITNVPQIGNMEYINPRAWRFLVMGDPTVDIFLSRDLDSQATLRERVAVAEWENSNLTFHSMRDHPGHTVGMMGGMWGSKNYLLGSVGSKELQIELLKAARLKQKKGWDQFLVTKHIYERHFSVILAHDSYYCTSFRDILTLPYSIQRHGGEMIGWRHLGSDSDLQPCPKKCRPTYGKNWKYC